MTPDEIELMGLLAAISSDPVVQAEIRRECAQFGVTPAAILDAAASYPLADRGRSLWAARLLPIGVVITPYSQVLFASDAYGAGADQRFVPDREELPVGRAAMYPGSTPGKAGQPGG